MKYDNYRNNDSINSKSNSEYIYILDEGTIWFVDYFLGVAFPTPISFVDVENGLFGSGLPYREFSDYLDFQNFLEEITGGQEVSLESSVNPGTFKETNSIIKWATRYTIQKGSANP